MCTRDNNCVTKYDIKRAAPVVSRILYAVLFVYLLPRATLPNDGNYFVIIIITYYCRRIK